MVSWVGVVKCKAKGAHGGKGRIKDHVRFASKRRLSCIHSIAHVGGPMLFHSLSLSLISQMAWRMNTLLILVPTLTFRGLVAPTYISLTLLKVRSSLKHYFKICLSYFTLF